VKHEQLPGHWREWVEARAAQSGRGGHQRLGAADFPNATVRLKFEDSSEASFRHAFFVEDRERNELAVFTEHCGYHVFYLRAPKYDSVPFGS